MKNEDDLSSSRSSLGSSATLRSKAPNRKNQSRPGSSKSEELYAETNFGGVESGYSRNERSSDESSNSSSDEDGAEKAPSSGGAEFSVYQIDEEEGRASIKMSEDKMGYNQAVSGKLSMEAKVYVQQGYEEDDDVHVDDNDGDYESKADMPEKMESESLSAREVDDNMSYEEVKEKYEKQERDEDSHQELDIDDSGHVAAEYIDEEKESYQE